jgi:hypothetical protein
MKNFVRFYPGVSEMGKNMNLEVLMKKQIIISAALVVMLLISNTSYGKQLSLTQQSNMKNKINNILKEVVDLTDGTVLIRCNKFKTLSNKLTNQDAQSIVQLIINDKKLSEDQILTSVYLIAYSYQEKEYWKVMLPLLQDQNTSLEIIPNIISPIPYGPGYGKAYNLEPYKKVFSIIKSRYKKAGIPFGWIDHLESGGLLKNNMDFIKDPETLNIYPSIKKDLGRSWDNYRTKL